MEPFFFGVGADRRFAFLHPSSNPHPVRGVVLCYPLGHEYFRAHRAFRNLATTLTKAGLPTLRFDYGCTGDSAGDSRDWTVAGCEADVDAAIETLRQRTGVRAVTVVGLRLGAALAARVSRRRSDVDRIILWDPVLNGTEYLHELATLQEGWLQDRLGASGQELLAGRPELIGMPLTDDVRREIEAIDLRRDFTTAAVTLVITSVAREDCVAWQRELKQAGVASGIACVPTDGNWRSPDAVHQLLLPHALVKTLVELVVGS